jgi:hypothetical protein
MAVENFLVKVSYCLESYAYLSVKILNVAALKPILLELYIFYFIPQIYNKIIHA